MKKKVIVDGKERVVDFSWCFGERISSKQFSIGGGASGFENVSKLIFDIDGEKHHGLMVTSCRGGGVREVREFYGKRFESDKKAIEYIFARK